MGLSDYLHFESSGMEKKGNITGMIVENDACIIYIIYVENDTIVCGECKSRETTCLVPHAVGYPCPQDSSDHQRAVDTLW